MPTDPGSVGGHVVSAKWQEVWGLIEELQDSFFRRACEALGRVQMHSSHQPAVDEAMEDLACRLTGGNPGSIDWVDPEVTVDGTEVRVWFAFTYCGMTFCFPASCRVAD